MKTKKTVIIDGMPFEFSVDRSKKRKNTYLCIVDGEVVVKTTKVFPIKSIENFVVQKQGWIKKKLLDKPKTIKEPEYEDDKPIYILGKAYKIRIIENSNKNNAEIAEDFLYIHILRGSANTIAEKFLNKLLEDCLTEIISEFSVMMNVKINSFKIKNLHKSWGRCSSKGDISFNKRLIYYDIDAIRYVALHELCHLKHLNHSKEFWNMVKFYMPDFNEKKALLNY